MLMTCDKSASQYNELRDFYLGVLQDFAPRRKVGELVKRNYPGMYVDKGWWATRVSGSEVPDESFPEDVLESVLESIGDCQNGERFYTSSEADKILREEP